MEATSARGEWAPTRAAMDYRASRSAAARFPRVHTRRVPSMHPWPEVRDEDRWVIEEMESCLQDTHPSPAELRRARMSCAPRASAPTSKAFAKP